MIDNILFEVIFTKSNDNFLDKTKRNISTDNKESEKRTRN